MEKEEEGGKDNTWELITIDTLQHSLSHTQPHTNVQTCAHQQQHKEGVPEDGSEVQEA